MRKTIILSVVAFGWIAAVEPAAAQVADADVREVLETSKIRNMLGTLGQQIVAAARDMAPGIDEIQFASIVQTQFAEDSLFNAAARHLRDSAAPELVAELRTWLLADSIRVLEAKADSGSNNESLEQFALRFQHSPPPAERVQLAVRFAASQRAGEFYVRYLSAVQAAAGRVATVITESADRFELSSEVLAQSEQQLGQVAVLSFLQRFEPLTDDELLMLVRAYESESGTWYVDAYTEAVAFAISDAAEKVVTHLTHPKQ